MEQGRIHFQVTEDHLRQATPGQHPLALALREAGMTGNPEVNILNTIQRDGAGLKIRTYSHSPPLARWLRRWNRGERMAPVGLILDADRRRINTTPGMGRI